MSAVLLLMYVMCNTFSKRATYTSSNNLILFASFILGGAKDLSELPAGSVSGLPVPMEGCLRRLQINWTPLPLNKSTILEGRNVRDCDGTACGGDICLHGGSCWLDIDLEAHCACTEVKN